MKRFLAVEGIEATTPRDTLKHAYRIGWLNDEAAWLRMLKDRKETSHVYNEEMARRIYDSIIVNFPEMQAVYRRISNLIYQYKSMNG